MSAKEAVQATEYGLGVLDAAIKLLQDSAVNQTNLVYHVPLAEKSGTVLVGTPTDVFKLPEYDTVQIHSKMVRLPLPNHFPFYPKQQVHVQIVSSSFAEGMLEVPFHRTAPVVNVLTTTIVCR